MRPPQERTLAWDDFLTALEELLEVHPVSTQASLDAALGAVAALATQVAPGSVPEPASFGAFPGFPAEVGFALTHRAERFLTVAFRIEPGATLPFHPHPGGSVCTLFLEGAATVRQFSFAEPPDWETKGEVLVREVSRGLLTPGRLCLVGHPVANIHGFRAGPDGARGVDITMVHDPDSSRPGSLLEIGDAPEDEHQALFRALWRDT